MGCATSTSVYAADELRHVACAKKGHVAPRAPAQESAEGTRALKPKGGPRCAAAQAFPAWTTPGVIPDDPMSEQVRGSNEEYVKISIVAALSGRELAQLAVDPKSLVADLHMRVAETTGVWTHRQQLVFGGTLLPAAASLEEAGIEDGSQVNLVVAQADALLTASLDGSVMMWRAATGECTRTFAQHEEGIYSVSLSEDCAKIVTASSDCSARVWHSATGECLGKLQGHTGGVNSVAISPDGTLIATACDDGVARLCSADSGECLRQLQGHTGAINHVSFSGDGALLSTASDDRTARTWSVRTGKCLKVFKGHRGRVWSAAFSPNGASLLTASSDTAARLFDARSGECRLTLVGHQQDVISAVFSPDGTMILTASDDRSAMLWTLDGELLHMLHGHEGPVRSACFSPDSKVALTTSEDCTAKLWLVSKGACVRTFCGHKEAVRACTFARGFVVAPGLECDENEEEDKKVCHSAF